MKALRLNLTQPGLDPNAMSARYQAALEMCEYVEQNGFDLAHLEEHHGVPNGWTPSPLVLAGLIFGRCSRLSVSIGALLLPLHDPIRVAEDIAVLDLASGGRLSVILGVGYRPSEYAAHGKDWSLYAIHALCGGMPIDEAWRCLTLFGDQVLPKLDVAKLDVAKLDVAKLDVAKLDVAKLDVGGRP